MSDNDFLDKFNRLQQSGTLDDLSVLRKENRELERIITDASLLISHSDIEGMIRFIIDRILDHFIPQFLSIIIQPPRGTGLRHYSFRNLKPSEESVPEKYFRFLEEYFRNRVMAASLQDLENHFGADVIGDDFKDFGPELIYPMQGIGGVYGVVILGKKFTDGDYGDLEKLYMERMIRFLSVSIQNGLHHESSLTDSKTGLFNYDYFITRLEEEIAHTARHESESGLIILDVDHFKNFNDTHGHVAGDEALLMLSRVLKMVTRSEDCVSRFGGEEFAVLVSHCDPEMLYDIAERIRKTVEETTVSFESRLLNITVSLGTRMITFTPGISAKKLLEDADDALYRAKHEGRNRVSYFSPSLLARADAIRRKERESGP